MSLLRIVLYTRHPRTITVTVFRHPGRLKVPLLHPTRYRQWKERRDRECQRELFFAEEGETNLPV